MTTAIQNSLTLWFHEMIAQPYQEGWRRVRRGVCGVDKHFVDWQQQPRLTIKERVISIAVGALLLLPFINAIIWVAMRTFGHPDILSNPLPIARPEVPTPRFFLPEWHLPPLKMVDDDDEKQPAPAAAPPAPIAKEMPSKVERARYRDTDKGVSIESDWTIETYAEKYVLTETNPGNPKYHTVSVFDKEWNLQSLIRREADSTQLCVTRTGQTLVGKKTSPGKRDRSLRETLTNPALHWIQGMTFGFRHFIRAGNKEILFYVIHPKDYELREAKMVFVKNTQLNGQEVLHYESSFCDGLSGLAQSLFSSMRASHWFYPDGTLVKVELPSFLSFSTELVHSLPE